MSRAKKFIDEHTRNYSNEILTNNKACFTNFPSKRKCHPWLTPEQARKAVEIASEEVKERLIEKMCEWLKQDMLSNLAFQSRIHRIEIIDNIIEKFRKALEED